MRSDSTPRTGCCYRSRRKEGIVPLMVRHDLCKQKAVEPQTRREKQRKIYPLCAQQINHICEDELEMTDPPRKTANCNSPYQNYSDISEQSSSDPDWSPSTEAPQKITRQFSLHLPKKFRKISTSSTFHSIEEEHHHDQQHSQEAKNCHAMHRETLEISVNLPTARSEPRVLFTLPSDDDDSNQ